MTVQVGTLVIYESDISSTWPSSLLFFQVPRSDMIPIQLPTSRPLSEQGALSTDESGYSASNRSSINSVEAPLASSSTKLTASNSAYGSCESANQHMETTFMQSQISSDSLTAIDKSTSNIADEEPITKHHENYLRLKILNLPIPESLQSYLLYNREI